MFRVREHSGPSLLGWYVEADLPEVTENEEMTDTHTEKLGSGEIPSTHTANIPVPSQGRPCHFHASEALDSLTAMLPTCLLIETGVHCPQMASVKKMGNKKAQFSNGSFEALVVNLEVATLWGIV